MSYAILQIVCFPFHRNGDVLAFERNKPLPVPNYQHQENFEVFIQTLISQALDPNFIAEIVKENGKYSMAKVVTRI